MLTGGPSFWTHRMVIVGASHMAYAYMHVTADTEVYDLLVATLCC